MSKKDILILLIILAISAFFRLWQLDSIPPGLYPDEAINGNEAIFSPGKVFYPENNGREGLFINLIALSFSIFGISIWSLKIVSAIIGILTVLGLYFLTKELFNHYKNDSCAIALLASFFLAVSFWHINFSRIGFRAILVPFLLVFSFYFLLKGFRTKKFLNFIIGGIFFGLGFYTYISFRLAIILLGVTLILWWQIYKKRREQKRFLFFISCFLSLVFIVTLPLGIYFIQNPQDFIGRATPISIFAASNPFKEFIRSLILHFGMFNFYGDPNWRHNFAGNPQTFWPVGILFLIGFLLLIKNLFLAKKRKRFLVYISCFILSWFFFMLLPGILTYEGIPHALRTIGVIPVVYIFAGFGGLRLYQRLDRIIKNKKILLIFCFSFFVLLIYGQFCRYFWNWGKSKEVENAFSKDFVEIGNYLNELPTEIQKYVIVNQPGVPVPYPDGIPMPAQTPMFIESTKFGKPKSTYLLPEDLKKIKIQTPSTEEKKTIIIPLRYDKELFNELNSRFPEGKIQQKNGIWEYQIK